MSYRPGPSALIIALGLAIRVFPTCRLSGGSAGCPRGGNGYPRKPGTASRLCSIAGRDSGSIPDTGSCSVSDYETLAAGYTDIARPTKSKPGGVVVKGKCQSNC
ncbi:MAG: hypothetical protein HY673_15530 [Chloroflexi bacterium]|nr:hypothetical protein [Chloroflexota bacterium]